MCGNKGIVVPANNFSKHKETEGKVGNGVQKNKAGSVAPKKLEEAFERVSFIKYSQHEVQD